MRVNPAGPLHHCGSAVRMLLEILILLISLFGALYYCIVKDYDYWKKRNVVFIKPQFPLGIAHDQLFGGKSAGEYHQQQYDKYKKQGLKYVGGFFMHYPTLIIFDLDLIKQILIKDFNYWVSRDFVPTTHEYISNHLFAMEGQPWKEMRVKLTPTFTSGKMKNMFLLMEKCAQQLQEHVETDILRSSTGEFKVKDLTARFTTDIIATCAFGLEVNSIKDRENEFYKVGQLIFRQTRGNILKYLSHKIFPKISRLLKIDFYDPRVSELLSKITKDTVEYRKKNNVVRNDFIDLLLRVRENKSLEDYNENGTTQEKEPAKDVRSVMSEKESKRSGQMQLTLEEMTAQAFVFFAAGFETAASTTSFCLYELAKNPEIQETLRQEIDEVLAKHGGKVTYQAIQDMTYLEQVVNETLRMYASLPFLIRVCTASYRLPGGPQVDPGVRVHVPVYAIHHDPELYPDPYRFDPERFTEAAVKDRHPLSFLPFGDGPRNCIGLRFGKLQVKVGLVAILSRFQLLPAPDTPPKLELDPFLVFTTPKQAYSLRIASRTDN